MIGSKVASWSLVSSALLGLLLAGCSSDEGPADGGTDASADAVSEVSLLEAGDVSVSDAIDESDMDAADEVSDAVSEGGEGGTCDDCGSMRIVGACASADTACLNDPGCAAIRSCVFTGGDGSAACTLGPSGAACVLSCMQTYCTDVGSATLYHALDTCVYCSTCSASCSTYCGGFPDAGVSCRGAQ